MLTTEDKKFIEDSVNGAIKKGLIEFYETLLVPYFDHNEKDHKEIKEQISIINEHINDHEKRINKLEIISSSQ